MALIAKYCFFALVATLANLLCQFLAGRAHAGPYELYLSMGAGTLAGLVVKYIWLKYRLDKRFVFVEVG
jgi:hypothetical protein